MVHIKNLNDPYLNEHLSPVFLNAVKDFWKELTYAESLDDPNDGIEKAKYNLVKFVFRKAFQKLYYKHKPLDLQGDLFLISAIHSDGIGDFMQLLNVAKLVRENFPTIKVYVVYTHKQKLPTINPQDYHLKADDLYAFEETEDLDSVILSNVLDEKITIDYEQELEKLIQEKNELENEYKALIDVHVEAAAAIKSLIEDTDDSIARYTYFSNKKRLAVDLYNKMQTSLAIIHIALAVNTFDNPKLQKNSLYFAEAGNFQGIANYLQKNWYSLGFGAFDEGMFLKNDSANSSWGNKFLAEFLFGKEEPQESDYQDYAKKNSLHVAYLPRVEQQKDLYIQLVAEKNLKDQRNIDIILCKNDKIEQKFFTSDWMSSKNISQIEMIYFFNQNNEIKLCKNVNKKKSLRLIFMLPIPREDFLKLLSHSDELVGCTGDGSFSDCLKEEKIPFYEIRPHKMQLIESLTYICLKQTLPEVLDYFNLLIQFSDFASLSYSTKFVEILNEETFKGQWNDFLKFIKEYYVFEDAFVAHLSRHILINKFPFLKTDESIMTREYFESSNSFQYLYESFEQILKKNK